MEVSQSRFLTAATLKSGTSSTISGHYSPLSSRLIRSSCSGSLYASNESESEYGTGNGNLDDDNSSNSCERVSYNDYDDCEADGEHRTDVREPDTYSDYELQLCESNNNNDDYFKHDLPLNFDETKVIFPEAGVVLVHKSSSIDSDLSQDSGIKLIDSCSSWQENWKFKKSKDNRSYHQYNMYSDIHYGYEALALSKSVPMLIPNPSQSVSPLIGEAELDQISDLSEHNSETGSIVFSDDDVEPGEAELSEVDDLVKPTVNIEDLTTKVAYIEKIKQQRLRNLANKKPYVNRWIKINVPDFVPSELRTICSLMPNPHTDLENIPNLSVKPGNASIHSGILAQFCCKSKGLMPIYFAWYKDGQLIAASDDSRTLEYEQNRLARIYFGLRFIHRRYVESSCSSYRLIVFNDSECILELKKSNQSHSGVYSCVAYNHYGYDWTDFCLMVDRTHYSANKTLFGQPLSPRPVRRRPQNKPRKVCLFHFLYFFFV